MRSPSRDARTQPVPSMSAWADGSASTANTASGAASIVVDAVTRSVSIPLRRLTLLELIARLGDRSRTRSLSTTKALTWSYERAGDEDRTRIASLEDWPSG